MSEFQEHDDNSLNKGFPPISRDSIEKLAGNKEITLDFTHKIEDYLAKHDSLGGLFLSLSGEAEQRGVEMYFGAGIIGALLVEAGFEDKELSIDLIHGVMGSWLEEKRKDVEATLLLLDTDPNMLAAVNIVAGQSDYSAINMIIGAAILVECYESKVESDKLGEDFLH